jgi:hypothetical protein
LTNPRSRQHSNAHRRGTERVRRHFATTLVASIVDDHCDGDVKIPLGMIVSEKELTWSASRDRAGTR